MQRLYVEEWVQVVGEIRPDLSEGEARAAVHATLALLHSPTEYKSGLPRDALTPLLARMALGALQAATRARSVPSSLCDRLLTLVRQPIGEFQAAGRTRGAREADSEAAAGGE